MASSTLRGDGVFSTHDAGFARFLSNLGTSDRTDHAFVARNFLLDEGVRSPRVVSYRAAGAVGAHADYPTWLETHNKNYLERHVFRESLDQGPPALIDADDELSCPETFRVATSSPFASANGGLELVRVEEVTFIAAKAARPRDAVLATARDALPPDPSPDRLRLLDALLDMWARAIELRPVFAAFWDDVSDVFGATPAGDRPDWAEQLRDRLGLGHHDPAERGGPIDVLVFRYRVDTVPALKADRTSRPLLPPTVLDGRHSPAFFPAPAGSLTGHTLDLSGERDRPCREILHPTVAFRARHLFRVGTIRRQVDTDLRVARGLHLVQVREQSGRDDYAAGTDGDLL